MPDSGTTRGVGSDETLFAIIEHLGRRDGAGVTELADEMGLAKSTIHGHLTTMREYGFVINRNGEYRLGLEFFKYGQQVRTVQDVYGPALDVLERLADETGESSWLMTHENGRVMVLDGRTNNTGINVNSLVGSWAHMHANSCGKAILAHLSDEEIDQIIEEHGLPAKTDSTITNRAQLDEELAAIRDRGYAFNFGEDLRGIHAAAIPLFDDDDVVAAIAVAGPAHRVDRERCEGELADRLRAAADDIELSLAYQ